YDGDIPAAPVVSGDLITGVELTPNEDGFLLTLALSDDVPVEGEASYGETVVAGGKTAIQVFAADSRRTAFQAAWLEPGNAVPAIGTSGFVADETASGPESVEFDAMSNTLTIKGVDGGYNINELSNPSRVDVVLSDTSAGSDKLGRVHSDLGSSVTGVDVTE